MPWGKDFTEAEEEIFRLHSPFEWTFKLNWEREKVGTKSRRASILFLRIGRPVQLQFPSSHLLSENESLIVDFSSSNRYLQSFQISKGNAHILEIIKDSFFLKKI